MSLLKKSVGSNTRLPSTLPQFDQQGEVLWVPRAVLDMTSVCEKKHLVTKWLIHWDGLPMEDVTWENAQAIIARFPSFAAGGPAAS